MAVIVGLVLYVPMCVSANLCPSQKEKENQLERKAKRGPAPLSASSISLVAPFVFHV